MSKTIVTKTQHRFGDTHFSIGQASRYLDVSVDTIRRWERTGKLSAHRLDGKNRYFLKNDLERFKSTQPMSTTEAAKALGVSQSTVRRLEEQGKLVPKRDHNGKRLYNRQTVEQFLANWDNDHKETAFLFQPTEAKLASSNEHESFASQWEAEPSLAATAELPAING